VQYTSTIKISSSEVFKDLEGKEAKKLIQELNKILIYWFTSKNTKEANKKIEKVIVVGKGVLTDGFEEKLEGGLKLDVILANTWTNCFNPEKYVPELSHEDALEYAVATGLALKAIQYK
jgi:Tfp pilus assembly PilM family ATPase